MISEQLRGCTETELLNFVRDILAQPHPLTFREKYELMQLNDEFTRRDAMRLRKLCYYCYQAMGDGPHCAKCGAL